MGTVEGEFPGDPGGKPSEEELKQITTGKDNTAIGVRAGLRSDSSAWVMCYTLRYLEERRAEELRRKKLEKRLGYAAVTGVAVLIWFVTFSFPVEHWYVGIIGILLIVPYLTVAIERIENK